MSESHTFARTTISIPRALKRRMDEVEGPVNWSGVAAAAFEAKLKELQSRMEAKSVEEAVRRLRAAAELEANEDYQDGLQAGRDWAMEAATPKQLRRIADYLERDRRESPGIPWWDVDQHRRTGAPIGVAERFVAVARPGREADGGAAQEFWEEALGDDAPRVGDADFLRGFGEGAVEVWNQVRDRL